MEHKQMQQTNRSSSYHPLGMCEKLFNAFQLTLRPLRRLTFHQQDPSPPLSDNVHPIPQPPQPQPQPQPPPQPAIGKPKPKPKPKPAGLVKAHEEKLVLPTPAPPKAEVRPLGALPQPPTTLPPKAEVHKTMKGGGEEEKQQLGLNERVDEFITRTKGKIRIGSGVGKAPTRKGI